MATMYNPPHLGELIRESVEAEGWSVTETARRLGIGRVALSRVLNGHAGVSAALAAGAGADRLEQRRTLDADAGELRPGPRAPQAGGRGRLLAMQGFERRPIDWAALLPKVARHLFGEPGKGGGDVWRYGPDEALELHVRGPRRGTWYDHKAGGGGDTLDLVKHVLRLDEANAIRWLKDQGLIRSPPA